MGQFLVVDDNLPFAENLAEILQDAGHDARVVGSGREAVAAVHAQRFDALLTDMRMPGMDGACVVHEVRQVDPGLPALVIAAFLDAVEVKEVRHEGVLAVLPKPVPLSTLAELLSRARRDGLVMLVEADAALAHTLREALRERGFSTATVESLAELERLELGSSFALLVDLQRMGGTGTEGLRALQARYPALPVLLMTDRPAEARPDPGTVALLQKRPDAAGVVQALERIHEQRAQV